MTEQDKRTLILQATLDLIAEEGWLGAPMAKVAKRAGVSAGIIYHYFANKDDLIRALYAQIKKQWSASVVAGDALNAPYPDHLVQLWLNSYHFYVQHPKEALFIEQYENSPTYEHAWDDMIAEDEAMQSLAMLLQADFDAGHITPRPLVVFYDMTIGVAMSLAKRTIRQEASLTSAELHAIAHDICQSVSASPRTS
jgi:AcrR family transcriptional regulator